MIALLGATGTIGRHVAAGLAERGIPARALVRDPARGNIPLEAVLADLHEPRTLRPALDGAEQLFLLTPHGPDQDLLEARAIEAALAAGVRRIVKVSGSSAMGGPNGPSSTAVAHWRSERLIEDSGLRFCFLRPSFFMQNLLTMAAPMVAKLGVLMAPFGSAPIAMVDARDVADCAIAAITAADPTDGAWHLTGAGPVTFDAIASSLGVPHVKVRPRVAAAALRRRGASPFEVEHAIRMAVFFGSGADGTSTDAVRRLRGRPARRIEDFLAEHADAFAGRRWPLFPRLLPLVPSPKGS